MDVLFETFIHKKILKYLQFKELCTFNPEI